MCIFSWKKVRLLFECGFLIKCGFYTVLKVCTTLAKKKMRQPRFMMWKNTVRCARSRAQGKICVQQLCVGRWSFVIECGITRSNSVLSTSWFSAVSIVLAKVALYILIPKTIGNRKRDCAWGCAQGTNTTWENLQIEKHKSGRRWFRSPDWFVLFDLQIFSGGVYSPSATSRTISFSISNSFWY